MNVTIPKNNNNAKSKLKDALLTVLESKNIHQVTIKELCQVAQLNRSTFYKYYGSQYDLLTDIEQDVIQFVNQALHENNSDIFRLIYVICCYLEENVKLIRLLINNNIDPNFPEKLFSLKIVQESFLSNYQYSTMNDIEYLYNYITYGTFRILSLWINREQRESPEKLAKHIESIITHRHIQ